MLALRFAWDAQKDFDAVIFQICFQRSPDTTTAELIEPLPIDVKTRPPGEQHEAAKDWLRRRQLLLILDDVASTQLRQLEPGTGCSVPCSARLRSLPGHGVRRNHPGSESSPKWNHWSYRTCQARHGVHTGQNAKACPSAYPLFIPTSFSWVSTRPWHRIGIT